MPEFAINLNPTDAQSPLRKNTESSEIKNSRVIQNALERLNKIDPNLEDRFKPTENSQQRDFLSVLTQHSAPVENARAELIDAFAEQSEFNQAVVQNEIQPSAQGFISEAPKLI